MILKVIRPDSSISWFEAKRIHVDYVKERAESIPPDDPAHESMTVIRVDMEGEPDDTGIAVSSTTMWLNRSPEVVDENGKYVPGPCHSIYIMNDQGKTVDRINW